MADAGGARAGLRTLLGVLTPAERRRIPGLLALMVAVASLEVVGVGGFLPLAALLSEPQRVLGTTWGRTMYAVSGAHDPAGFAIRLGVALLALFVVKVALTSYTLYAGFRFSYDVQVSVSIRILQGLLGRDYEFFLTRNSASLLKDMTQEVMVFTGGVLVQATSAVTQTLILVMVMAGLAVISPGTAAFTLALVGGLSAALYAVIHPRLNAWGKTREERLTELTRVAHQALSGVKAIKVSGAERLYVDGFRHHGTLYARSNTLYQTAAATPTLLIELVVFGGAVGVMLYYAAAGLDIARLIPTVTVFGAAAYRILPAARMLFSNAVTLRYNWRSVAVMAAALDDGRPAGTAPVTAAALPPVRDAVALEGVSYRYPTGARVLSGVDVRIPVGGSVAFVGSSGAGKSTLVDVLMGLLEPEHGVVTIDGAPLTRATRRGWQAQIGYVPQHLFLADATLRENIALGVPAAEIDDERVLEAVRRASLDRLLERLPTGLATPLGENGVRLSGGERQRVAIARALYRRPRVLVLDEATSALDTLTEREINEEVLASSRGITLVIVTHRLATVRGCDRVVLLRDGRVAANGSYDELLRTSPEFAAMDRQAGPALAEEAA